MKRYVKAESKVQEFLRYHDDEHNYAHNSRGFDEMYDILQKYDDSNGNDTVDVAFLKATPADQDKMIELIRPGLRIGQHGYAKWMFNKALSNDIENADSSYCDGITDAFEILEAEGYISMEDFAE